jgi:c-di-GMP-binding flagellar brake protein YcgR
MTLAPVDALLRERRGSFRLRIPLRMNVYGEARDLDGQDQTLELYDLSRDGLSAEVREVQHWQPGERLQLQLGIAGERVAVEAEIRWLRRRGAATLVGLRFLDLDSATVQRLDHGIGRLQRQWLRTRVAV